MDIHIRANATPSTAAIIEVDRGGGTVLTTHGHGIIDVHSNSKEKEFSLGGSYGVNEGQFKLNVLGMINRELSISDTHKLRAMYDADIQAGDRVIWNGETYEVDGEVFKTKSPTGRVSSTRCTIAKWAG